MLGMFTSESIRPLLVLRCHAAEIHSPSNLPPAVLDHLPAPVGPPQRDGIPQHISIISEKQICTTLLNLPSRLPALKVHLVWADGVQSTRGDEGEARPVVRRRRSTSFCCVPGEKTHSLRYTGETLSRCRGPHFKIPTVWIATRLSWSDYTEASGDPKKSQIKTLCCLFRESASLTVNIMFVL